MTDTGAGFYEGSTDITRTYALGEVTPLMKEHFTLVAVSNLRLADAKFLKGAGYPGAKAVLGSRHELQSWNRTRGRISAEYS